MAKYHERIWVCDTMTGAKRALIPASAFSYSRVMNVMGSGTMTLPVRGRIAKKLDLRNLLHETKNTLVYEVDNRVVAAGLIGNTDYDFDSGMLQVSHHDLWLLMELRKAIKHGVLNAMIAHLEYTGLSLSTIAKRLLQEAVAPGSQWSLPLLLPADVAGTQSRTYYGYQMQSVADALQELTDTAGGPDIDLRPQWDLNGRLQWAPRIGDLATGKTWWWNLDAPKHGLLNVGLATDSSKVTTTSYLIGEGSEKNTLYASDPSADVTYPAMERDLAYKNVTNRQELVPLAMEHTRAHAAPTQQWRASITKDGKGKLGSPTVQDLRLGDTARVHSSVDPWIPKGWDPNTLIKFSGEMASEFVKLEFQQIGA